MTRVARIGRREVEVQVKRNKRAYGQGPREQYGEGYSYRREELTEGADDSQDHGWAGGKNDKTVPLPDTKPER